LVKVHPDIGPFTRKSIQKYFLFREFDLYVRRYIFFEELIRDDRPFRFITTPGITCKISPQV
jgi:hypothetical protein